MNNSEFDNILNTLVTIPQLIKNNTEKMELITQKINEVNKNIGKTISGFSSSLSELKELKAILNKLDTEELKQVAEGLKIALEPLKNDLKEIIVNEVSKEIQSNIEIMNRNKIRIKNDIDNMLKENEKKTTGEIATLKKYIIYSFIFNIILITVLIILIIFRK